MKIVYFLCLSFLFLNLSSCKDDDNENEPISASVYEDLGTITGLDFFDEVGAAIGSWKSPNHYPGEITTYPIPNNGNIFVISPNKIIRVWLIPTECATDATMDIPALSQNLNYTIPQLENLQVKDMMLTDFNNQIALNFEDVTTGFYKIFYELENGNLFWQNLYIDPATANFPSFDFLDNLCD